MIKQIEELEQLTERLLRSVTKGELQKAVKRELETLIEQRNSSKAKQNQPVGYVGGICLIEERKDLKGTYYPRGIGDIFVKQTMENPKRQVVYYNHDRSRPVGKVLKIWIEEVARKRYVMLIAAIYNEKAWEDIENRKINGFSFSGQIKK